MTAQRVARVLKVDDVVRVSVAAVNSYSFPALPNESSEVVGKIVTMARDGCYVRLGHGQQFVRFDSIVGGTHG